MTFGEELSQLVRAKYRPGDEDSFELATARLSFLIKWGFLETSHAYVNVIKEGLVDLGHFSEEKADVWKYPLSYAGVLLIFIPLLFCFL